MRAVGLARPPTASGTTRTSSDANDQTTDYASLMVEILKDNSRPDAGAIYGAIDMPWAKLVGQIAQAYAK